MQNHKLQEIILRNVYSEKIALLRKINSTGILPYLPDDLILYIIQFLVTSTDYIVHYIEKMYNTEQTQLDMEILPYMIQLHNNPDKVKICKNWDYGEEFFLISERHKDGNAFYSSWNNWNDSFLCDFKQQILCISKARSSIGNKDLLAYILPMNKILRINYECGMFGTSYNWEKDLGPYFQNILDANEEIKNEILSIWNSSYAKSFKSTTRHHQNGKKEYFSNNPDVTWMCSFVTDFMMHEYH
jgi:hypothetical protein